MPLDTMLVFRYHVPAYPETSLHREPLVEGCRSPPSAKYAKDGAPTDFRHVKGGPPATSSITQRVGYPRSLLVCWVITYWRGQ